MITSSKIFKKNVSEFPKNNLKRNSSDAESKKNCSWVVTILRENLTIQITAG